MNNAGIRETTRACFRAVLRSPTTADLTFLSERLIRLLGELMGSAMDIDTEFCDHIERGPSGKRPVIVHEPGNCGKPDNSRQA